MITWETPEREFHRTPLHRAAHGPERTGTARIGLTVLFRNRT